MLRNYVVVAFRNLVRHKVYALVNICGLAIGIAFCILTFLFVRHEWTYDRFHENAERIHRMVMRIGGADGEVALMAGMLPLAAAPILEETVPEVERAVRFAAARSPDPENRIARVTYQDKSFDEELLFASASFLEVFSFPLQGGDPRTALADLNSVVLSEAAARKYFGDENPLGKQLSVRLSRIEPREFTVTGVMEPVPRNSSLRFDFLLPFANTEYFFYWDISSWKYACEIFLLAEGGTDVEALRDKVETVVLEKMLPPGMGEKMMEKMRGLIQLRPLTGLHLDKEVQTRVSHGLQPPSDPLYAYVLAGITVLVLVIACINFINLSVGRSVARAREVGVRKVVGAVRGQLAGQFLGEALVVSGIALFFGIALAELFLPAFNGLVNRELVMEYGRLSTVAAFLGLVVLIGLAAGGYPALVLSGFQPVEVLRGRLRIGGRNVLSRGLMVVQFGLSVFLIVSALVMARQLRFVQERDLGFNQEQVVAVNTEELHEMGNLHGRLKERFLQHHQVVSVATLRYPLMSENWDMGERVRFPDGDEVKVRQFFVDYDFLRTLEMKLVGGRDFSAEAGDLAEGATIVNQALVEWMGWQDPVGEPLPFEGREVQLVEEGSTKRVRRPGRVTKVIGVVRDFHYQSLHNPVQPTALILNRSIGDEAKLFLVRIGPGDVPATLAHMREAWQEVAPGATFRYSFLDQDIDRFYREERRWGQMVGFGSLFAVFIACLGAFGLTVLAVSRRTKEIGIRKALGASSRDIVGLLSREFVVLVGVASLIAWPAAWYAMNWWLRDFAYRVELSAGVFVLGGLLTLAVVVPTVSLQAVRAALGNPTDALRYE